MFCRKCGAKILDDSIFCSRCGAKVSVNNENNSFNSVFPKSTSNNEVSKVSVDPLKQKLEEYAKSINVNTASSHGEHPSFLKKYWLYILLVVVGIAISIAAIIASNNTPDDPWSSDTDEEYVVSTPALTPVVAPASGTIIFGQEGYVSEITINTSSQSCVVKLKDSYGTDVISFFVRAHETVTVGLPGQFMYVYFASGETWYGENELFGEDTYYSMDDNGIDFSQYTMEYTLYPVTNGNFSETPIDENEF